MNPVINFFVMQVSLIAVVLVLHTYIGLHIIRRGIIFSDLALNQLAAFGLIVGIACYVTFCQWSILNFFFIVLYSLPFRILRNSEKVFDVGETLDHVQPAIRSSPVIRRDHVSECDGVDQTVARRGTPRRNRSHPFVMCV